MNGTWEAGWSCCFGVFFLEYTLCCEIPVWQGGPLIKDVFWGSGCQSFLHGSGTGYVFESLNPSFIFGTRFWKERNDSSFHNFCISPVSCLGQGFLLHVLAMWDLAGPRVWWKTIYSVENTLEYAYMQNDLGILVLMKVSIDCSAPFFLENHPLCLEYSVKL